MIGPLLLAAFALTVVIAPGVLLARPQRTVPLPVVVTITADVERFVAQLDRAIAATERVGVSARRATRNLERACRMRVEP